MSAVTARPIGAAGAVQPTAEGERALRRALGYMACADSPDPRRAYAGNLRHFTV